MLTVQELAGKIQKKEVSPVEVTDAVVARIERLNPTINAYTTLALDRARDAAKAAEREIAAGKYRGPFPGIPVGIKDLNDRTVACAPSPCPSPGERGDRA